MIIKLVLLGMFLSKLFPFVFSMLNVVFLQLYYLLQHLSFFKSAVTVFNLPTSNSSMIVFKLLKLVGILAGLFISSLITSAFKAIESFLATKSDVSMLVTCSNLFLVA